CDAQQRRPRHPHPRAGCAGMRGASAVARGTVAAQPGRARAVPGFRGHRRGAARSRIDRLTVATPPVSAAPVRCGIDTVEIARIERLLIDTPASELVKLFTLQELDDSGQGAGRAASLAARYAAKEAGVRLFPRELAAGRVELADFSVIRDGYGAPRVS